MKRPLLDKTHFDTVIVGTGITESIIAAALGRIQKSVLVLDANDYYGSKSSTFNLHEAQKYLTTLPPHENESDPELKNASYKHIFPFRVLDLQEYVPLPKKRWYYFDLIHTFCYSDGGMVDSLAKSNIGRYMEFRSLSGVSVYMDKEFRPVPGTKGEIFSSKYLNLKEKHFLMKFMKKIVSGEEEISEEEKKSSFVEFLKKGKLSDKIRMFLMYPIAGLTHDDKTITTEEGLKRVKQYLASLQKYGSSCFLYPIYGVSELSQSFSRTNAVFGGYYVLGRTIYSLKTTTDEKKIESVVCTRGQNITFDHLVLNRNFTYLKHEPEPTSYVYRMILVTSFFVIDPRNFKDAYKENSRHYKYGALYGIFPPGKFGEKQKKCVTFTQLDYTSKMAAGKDYILSFQIEFDKKDDDEAKEIFEKIVETFVNDKIRKDKELIEIEEKTFREEIKQIVIDIEKSIEERNKNNDGPKEVNAPKNVSFDVKKQEWWQRKNNPKVLKYKLMFSISLFNNESGLECFENVKVCKDVKTDLTYLDETVKEAEDYFLKRFPNEGFLAKLPSVEAPSDRDAELLGIDQKKIADEVNQEKSENESKNEEEPKSETEKNEDQKNKE